MRLCFHRARIVAAKTRAELTFARVRWRSAYVPYRKSESARALPSRSDCGLGHRRKRSQKLSGIDCVAAAIQLAGREPLRRQCDHSGGGRQAGLLPREFPQFGSRLAKVGGP
jgi:hypothetical protein